MTAIATDGRAMAADSRSVAGEMIVTEAQEKLFYAADGSVVGCAGEAAICALVQQWFEDGEPLDKLPEFTASEPDEGSPFGVLVLRRDGTVEYMDHNFSFTTRQPPAAIGSGGQVAIGAMRAGKSPKEAVTIAASCVVSVGGQIVCRKPRRGAPDS